MFITNVVMITNLDQNAGTALVLFPSNRPKGNSRSLRTRTVVDSKGSVTYSEQYNGSTTTVGSIQI